MKPSHPSHAKLVMLLSKDALAPNATCALIYHGIPNAQPMKDSDNLTSLRGLHQDLLALEKSQLLDIERLWVNLESRIDDFKKLLDKSPRKEASRHAILSGTYIPEHMHRVIWMLIDD